MSELAPIPQAQEVEKPMSRERRKKILDALEAKVGLDRGLGIVGQLRYNYYIDDQAQAELMTSRAIEGFIAEYGLEIDDEDSEEKK